MQEFLFVSQFLIFGQCRYFAELKGSIISKGDLYFNVRKNSTEDQEPFFDPLIAYHFSLKSSVQIL